MSSSYVSTEVNPAPDTQHALEDRVEVWNVTVKLIRLPSSQIIMAKSSTKVKGWEVWKNHDIVKAWLATGALTETDPGTAPPEGEVMETFTTPLSPAPSVFTGKIQAPRKPEPSQQPQEPASVP